MLGGFKKELEGRLESLRNSRSELEQLFAKRLDDVQIEMPENGDFKQQVLVAIRSCESAFTSYAGSVRSIKAVVDILLQ